MNINGNWFNAVSGVPSRTIAIMALITVLLIISAGIMVFVQQRHVPVNSLNGVTVGGLSGGVVNIPAETFISSVDMKVNTAYLQDWPEDLYDSKGARNIYFIVSKDTLNGINIKAPEVSLSDLSAEKDWGNYEKIFANVVVPNEQFVNIRINKINSPSDHIDLYQSQYADFSKSASGAVLFEGQKNEDFIFVTITAIKA